MPNSASLNNTVTIIVGVLTIITILTSSTYYAGKIETRINHLEMDLKEVENKVDANKTLINQNKTSFSNAAIVAEAAKEELTEIKELAKEGLNKAESVIRGDEAIKTQLINIEKSIDKMEDAMQRNGIVKEGKSYSITAVKQMDED